MSNLAVGATLPDFELPDHDGNLRRLSVIAGGDPMVVLLGRGDHCPRERQHQREMVKLHEWATVAFTQMVTVLPNDLHTLNRMRLSIGAAWTFLSDEGRSVQRALDIAEYTDPVHDPNVPHTLVLAPGLLIEKVYVGYWFWGRPSAHDLWSDLRELFRRIKADFDPTPADVRAAWAAVH